MLFEIAINPKARFGNGPSEMEYEKLALLPLLVLRIIPKLPLFLFWNPNFIQISQKQSLKKIYHLSFRVSSCLLGEEAKLKNRDVDEWRKEKIFDGNWEETGGWEKKRRKKVERKVKSGLSGICVRRFIKITITIVLGYNKLSQQLRC